MPLYDVKCKECGQIFELDIPLKNFDKFKEGQIDVPCMRYESWAKDLTCLSEKMEIIITPLKTRHKSWWQWRDVTK